MESEEVMSEVHLGCPAGFSGPYISLSLSLRISNSTKMVTFFSLDDAPLCSKQTHNIHLVSESSITSLRQFQMLVSRYFSSSFCLSNPSIHLFHYFPQILVRFGELNYYYLILYCIKHLLPLNFIKLLH